LLKTRESARPCPSRLKRSLPVLPDCPFDDIKATSPLLTLHTIIWKKPNPQMPTVPPPQPLCLLKTGENYLTARFIKLGAIG
jgi:hypothetical protein